MMRDPLTLGELALVRLHLDLIPDTAPVSSQMARRLLATADRFRAEADAAYTLLVADLTPDPTER